MIGSPVFGRLTLNVPNGRTFTITTSNKSATNKYIQSAKLNGAPLNNPCITYSQIMAGGSLAFVMGPTPSVWASAWRGVPLSGSK
jgi:putative alpha-1,2-mannosidase